MQGREFEPRPQIAAQDCIQTGENSWMSWISWGGPSMTAINKRSIPSPSPWAGSWYLYQNAHVHGSDQHKGHDTFIESGLSKGTEAQACGAGPSIAKAIFDAEWEAFKGSMASNHGIDHGGYWDKESLDREPGWPNCPYCDEGHDPCMPCFS